MLRQTRREARLQQMRDRLSVETDRKREARLQQMSANQQARLFAETDRERGQATADEC